MVAPGNRTFTGLEGPRPAPPKPPPYPAPPLLVAGPGQVEVGPIVVGQYTPPSSAAPPRAIRTCRVLGGAFNHVTYSRPARVYGTATVKVQGREAVSPELEPSPSQGRPRCFIQVMGPQASFGRFDLVPALAGYHHGLGAADLIPHYATGFRVADGPCLAGGVLKSSAAARS